MICPRCSRELRNLPEHLPAAVPCACNECLGIAEKPEKSRTVDSTSNMTVNEFIHGHRAKTRT